MLSRGFVPRYFGGFRLTAELGSGGWGTVYLAHDSHLDRLVALKVLHPHLRNLPSYAERFAQEAHAMAQVQHPSVVQIYEHGVVDGMPFIAMEYIRGQTLKSIIADRGPLKPKVAARLMEAVGRALSHVHTLPRPILHRDLSPGNILVVGEMADLHELAVKVTDFGLARDITGEEGLSVVQEALGTPGFASPEHARGKRSVMGIWSDVYALGALFYYTLTGRPPFLAESLSATLIQMERGDPIDPRRLNANIPADAAAIALKALERTPARRYASALDLAEDLKRFREGHATRARPPTAIHRALKWTRRKPAVAALSFTIVVVGVGSVGAIVNQWRRAEKETRIAQQRLAQNYQDTGRTLVRGVGRFFSGLLYKVEALKLAKGDPEAEDSLRLQIASHLISAPSLGKEIHLEGPIGPLVYSSDGKGVLVGAGEGSLGLRSASDLAPLGPVMKHETAVLEAVFSPDGGSILTRTRQSAIRLWRTSDGALLHEILPGAGNGSRAVFHPRQALAVIAVDAGAATELIMISTESGQVVDRQPRAFREVRRVCFSADGSRLAEFYSNGFLIEDTIRRTTIDSAAFALGELTDGDLNPEGTVMAVILQNGVKSTMGLKMLTAEQARFIPLQGVGREVRFSDNGKLLMALSSLQISLWEAETLTPLPVMQPDGLPWSAQIHPNSVLVSLSGPAGVGVYNAYLGQPIGPFLPARGQVSALGQNPQRAEEVLAGDKLGYLRLWRMGRYAAEYRVKPMTATNRAGAWISFDGTAIAIEEDQGVVVRVAGTGEIKVVIHPPLKFLQLTNFKFASSGRLAAMESKEALAVVDLVASPLTQRVLPFPAGSTLIGFVGAEEVLVATPAGEIIAWNHSLLVSTIVARTFWPKMQSIPASARDGVEVPGVKESGAQRSAEVLSYDSRTKTTTFRAVPEHWVASDRAGGTEITATRQEVMVVGQSQPPVRWRSPAPIVASCLSADGVYVAMATEDGEVYILDRLSGNLVAPARFLGPPPIQLRSVLGGRGFLAASTNAVSLFTARSAEEIALSDVSAGFAAVGWNESTSEIILVYRNGTVVVRAIVREARSVEALQSAVEALAAMHIEPQGILVPLP